jgi:hypothetical protein
MLNGQSSRSLLCSLILASALLFGDSASSVAAGGPTQHADQIALSNKSAAEAEVTSLLTSISPPSAAAETASEPAGFGTIPAFLRSPPGTVNPNLVVARRWWTVASEPAQVLAYMKAHLPIGATVQGEGIFSVPGSAVEHEDIELEWPEVNDVLQTRRLTISVGKLPDGQTGLLAEAEVVWLTPRPASERIPPGAHILTIHERGAVGGNVPRQHPLRITSAEKIDRVVRTLNTLHVLQSDAGSIPGGLCPLFDLGIRVTIGLYREQHSAPLALVSFDPDCVNATVSIDGRRRAPLEQGLLLVHLDHILGFKLDVGTKSGHGLAGPPVQAGN